MVEVEDNQYPPPPYNLVLYKGIKSYRLPRHFVTFLLTHPIARDYIDWVMLTAHAEEHTVATLARISNITRSHNGSWLVTQNREPKVQNLEKKIFVSVSMVLVNYLKDNGHLQNWGTLPCQGYIRNSVCVWSLPDLANILKEKENYVINKFRSDFDPFIIECIRDNIKHRERLESNLV